MAEHTTTTKYWGNRIHLDHLLDFYGPHILSTDATAYEEQNDSNTKAKPIPMAFSAAGPRARAAAEWHVQRPQVGQELLLLMAASRSGRAAVVAQLSANGEEEEPATAPLSELRRKTTMTRLLRRIGHWHREMCFPQNKVTPAARLCVWWLDRAETKRPVALCLRRMFDEGAPLKGTTLLPRASAVTVSRQRHLNFEDWADGMHAVEELYMWSCMFAREGSSDFSGIPTHVTPTRLRALTLRECSVSDLGFLAQLPELTYLDLAGCEGLDDFQDIGQLRQLRWLDLTETMCRDFYWLAGCTALEHLNVSSLSSFNTLMCLSSLTSLTTLLASGTMVESLEGLVTLYEEDGRGVVEFRGEPVAQSIEVLQLASTMLASLEGLECLSQLRVLDITMTEVEDVPTGTSAVHALSLQRCEVDGLGDLSWIVQSFPAVQILNLSECAFLEDLTPLIALAPTLRTLMLNRCDGLVSIPSELAEVLEELDVSGCMSLEDPEAIFATCRALRVLHAMGIDRVHALHWLAGCPHMEELELTAVDSLTSLVGLEHVASSLRFLAIADTAVTSVLPALPLCTRLHTFYCNDCPLDQTSVAVVRGMGFLGPTDHVDMVWST